MTLSEIKKYLFDNKISYIELSEKSGIPLGTLRNLFAKCTTNPRIDTMQAIEKALGLSDNSLWTAEDYENGVQDVKKISISPIEEDMLIAFRALGEKHGEKAQKLIISIIEKMNTSL